MSGEKRTIVLASRNEDKLCEMREICADLPFEVTSSLDHPGLPEIIEDGTTTLGNATRKALLTAAYTGEIAVADDTSFQVRILGGVPDIFASRFAGPKARYEDNTALMLEMMAAVPDEARDARFETSMVWIDPRPAGRLDTDEAAPAAVRWLHDPYARSIALGPNEDPDRFWNELSDRRRAWADYHAWMRTVPTGWGLDRERLVGIVDELVAPFLAGGRPADAPDDAVRLPDTRLWTAAGRDDRSGPQVRVAPAGLPAEAPGRATNAATWLELATEGRLLGRIGRQPVGVAGFGYDPIFVPAGGDRTLAELAPHEKHAISHRGRALRRLVGAVARVYDRAGNTVAAR